jgi:hypothetical protein
MAKLNQIIAVSNQKKADFKSEATKIYQVMQKPTLFEGLDRNYQAKDDADEKLPAESQKVQFNVKSLLEQLEAPFVNMADVVCTQDLGNQQARANIEVDGKILCNDVPVTTLLFLEKQLTDLNTLVSAIPVLSVSDNWIKADNNMSVSNEVVTHRTKKVQKPIVLYQATPEHPAQTQLITEDIVAGYWHTKKISGAISYDDKTKMLKRLSKLKEAVILAREQANSQPCEDKKIGKELFTFIFE